jgi:hypothetical protein
MACHRPAVEQYPGSGYGFGTEIVPLSVLGRSLFTAFTSRSNGDSRRTGVESRVNAAKAWVDSERTRRNEATKRT